MNLLPKSKEEFKTKEYWDAFFKNLGNKTFEWYGEYPELCVYLHKYLKQQDDILIVGCGNSSLGKDLYDIGYSKIINIDISNIVIRKMLSQNVKDRPGLQYIQMDALNTSFENEKFSAILDKGTLDALMPDSSEETIQRIDLYFSEVQRLLRLGGRYICISLLQKHILNKLLEFFSTSSWMFRVVRCVESELKSIENNENSMPVFMIVCTKFKQLPRKILEVNLSSGEKMLKCEAIEEVVSLIGSSQKAAFVLSSLKKINNNEELEVPLDLYEQNDALGPKYTVFVVQIPFEAKNSPYAAFIVPEGREAEWLFSTKEGRKNLTSMTKHNRLSIVTLYRGKKYQSLEHIKKELEETICNLAPPNLKNKKIAFLTLGSDVGKRIIKYEGNSQFSGDYVIEDVEHENGSKFRRLFYLSSQLVIQSEAKLKTIKSKSGKEREIIDLATLTCQHHIYMTIAACIVSHNKEESKIVVLGLGGGGLCSFLHRFFSKATIIGVDIDPEMLKIATEWFGFNTDNKLKAKVQDGLQFLRDLNKADENLDVILCDVDNKDAEVGMSCPPKDFISTKTLNIVSNLITNKGIFIVNIVLRDQTLRPDILNRLNHIFKKVVSYKLTEDLNEIFVCTNMELTDEHLKNNLLNGGNAINIFLMKNGVKDEVDLSDYIDKLKINS